MKRKLYSSIALSLLLLTSNIRSAAGEQVFVVDKFLRETVGLNESRGDRPRVACTRRGLCVRHDLR
jgi:hypothetical protein